MLRTGKRLRAQSEPYEYSSIRRNSQLPASQLGGYRRRARPYCSQNPPHPHPDVHILERHGRGTTLLQMRKPPKDRLVQDSRGIECHPLLDGERGVTGNRHAIERQSWRCRGLCGCVAWSSGVDRHAQECARRESESHRRLRRKNCFLRADGDGTEGNLRSCTGRNRRALGASLRRRPHHRRTGYSGEGAAGGGQRPGRRVCAGQRRRIAQRTCLGAKGIRADVRVFGCEPERADDAYRSLTTGTLQSLESSDTIADGLRASLAPRTFAILRRHVDRILLVTEEEIISAARLVWERMKIIIEPSSAVAIAPLLRPGVVASLNLPNRHDGSALKLGVLLSGGNVDLSSLPWR